MGRDIVTNIVANDKASKPLKDVAKAADAAADSIDDLSAADARLALAEEKAKLKVDLATKSLARSVERYGKESDQARGASIRLREAELALADAGKKIAEHSPCEHIKCVAKSSKDAGDAAEHAGDQFDRMRGGLGGLVPGVGKLTGAVSPLVMGLGRAGARVAAVGTVALTAAPAVIGLGVHMAVLGAHIVQFGGAVAPAAASLLPLAAGLALIKGTLIATGPAFTRSLSPITAAFVGVEGPVGRLATRGLPSLSREFVRVNFPAIRGGMEAIATSVNGVVLAVGKWINSTTGQKAIAASVDNITGAFRELAPDVSKLAVAFLNLFGRTAGDTRAVDLLAMGLNRAIVGATRFLDSLTPAKIDAAWAAIGRFAGGVQDFVGKLPGWGHTVMGAVRWWKAHADEIQHVRDVLGVVAVVVGVATGGWIPALVSGISLLVAHWDDVSGALERAKKWLGGTSDEAAATRGVIAGLSGVVGDLSSWFTGKLLPALERAGTAILPALRDAAGQVSKSLRDNKDIVGKVQAVLSVLGIVLTEAVIPALTWLFQHGLPLVTSQFTGMLTAVNKVVLPGLRIFTRLVLGFFGDLLDGAAFAFGWFPGVGDKLKTAAKQFGNFRDQVNRALSGIDDEGINVKITFKTPAGTALPSWYGKKMATGGYVSGPGGPREDRVPALLSNGEFVVNADATRRNRGALEAMNAPRFARGGLVLNTALPNPGSLAQAGRRIAQSAANQLAPAWSNAMAVNSAGPVGAGVARWAPLVLQVLRMLGQSAGALGPVLSRMRRESGGNPRAINLTDINAQRGDPSKGLMQTIGATFRAFAGPFRGRSIYDPTANVYAGLNYAIHRYGRGWVGRMTMPGGYDQGGLARGSGWLPKPTPAPERVLSPGQTVRFERAMNAAAGPTEVHYHFDRYIGNRDELIRELKAAHDSGRLQQIGIRT